MSGEAEEIKKLITFKKKLEKKVGKMESELKELETMLEAVNSILLTKGFKRAEIAKTESLGEVSPIKEEEESKEMVPLKTAAGEPLANLYVSENSLRLVLAEDKNFNINTPPFTQFLVDRVLAKMQEKDSELVRIGQVAPEKIFSYNIIRDGENIREIIIKNVDPDRLRELKSSIRWTLEKMYEKMRSQT